MEAFNLSMLGKQAWKLVKDPSSLLTSILKAKYFRRRGFLDTDIGHNPGYTWRVILGFRWKIGDGSLIRVWSDSWIRSLPSRKTSTPPPPNIENILVRDLMNDDLISWNTRFISFIFNAPDTNVILVIPLRDRSLVDSHVWNCTVNESYSVKSAYSLCMSLATESTTVGLDRNWNLIWKQPVLHKVRSFLWRVSHNCLPARIQLNQKGVQCKESCVSCAVMVETHIHLFFVCPKVIECWNSVQLGPLVRDMLGHANDFIYFLFDFFDRLSPLQQPLAAMILWSLWKNRNFKLWEQTDQPPHLIVKCAQDLLNEWQFMHNARKIGQSLHMMDTWTKPLITTLKCNVECALFNNNSITGYGIHCRDFAGQLVSGLSNFELSTSSPAEAEAIRLLEAIKYAKDRGMRSVISEFDCKIVIDVVLTALVQQNELGDIIHRCKELLASHNGYVVRHVRRQANKVAHIIARAALSHPSPHIFTDVPDYLYSLLLNEMA